MHLKWYHQFQFAGYYAAREQGYYREEGLDVVIQEAAPGSEALKTVLEGGAEYGVEGPEVLAARLQGAPVVVLAVIFQHSPDVILVRKDSGIRKPSDLSGRKLMSHGASSSVKQFDAMFAREGIPLDRIEKVVHSWDITDLIEGKVDAITAYITDEPYKMRQLGIEPALIRPIDYGIDFYGDTLFTTEEEIRDHPQRAAAFRRASLKGWEYAMSHVEEMIDLILLLPGVEDRKVDAELLRYEAEQMRELIQPNLIEMGHINPGRWERMADTYVNLKIFEPNYSLEGFIYESDPKKDYRWLFGLLGGLTGIILVGLLAWVWNRQLRQAVRRRTRELQDSEGRFRHLGELLPEIVWEATPEGRLTYANQIGYDYFGYTRDEFEKGISCTDAIVPEERPLAREKLGKLAQGGPGELREYTALKKDGTTFPALFRAAAIFKSGEFTGFRGLILDITDRKKLETQLRQAQKMEAIGNLAGGVAHDFNNLLQVIMGFTDMVLEDLEDDDTHRHELTQVQTAAKRASELTRQLLAFSRRQVIEPKNLDANTLIVNLIKMLRRLIGAEVELDFIPDENLGTIHADPGQIEQILMNLCVNARDAMENGGSLTIATKNVTLDGDFCVEHSWAKEGVFAKLSVSDTGHGMDKKTLEQIFEPFFTTKEVGKGTGLGLAMVYGIIQQHEGMIHATSEVTKGTRVNIYLPIVEKDSLAIAPEQINAPVPRGSETILVAEDEEMILSLTQETLKKNGYRVFTASDGEEALRVFQEHEDEIDLAILDVIMPKMSGHAVLERIHEKNQEVRFLLMSGYNLATVQKNFAFGGGLHLIQKPYQIKALLRKVRQVLDMP